MPHLDAAYNLARWLTGNDHDAEDVVQEAYLRAFKFFDSFHGTSGRAWLFTVVRNTTYTWLKRNRAPEPTHSLDESLHAGVDESLNPERLALQIADRQMVRQALELLPVEYREVIVLREFEELSYKQIASITGVPLGTVMSRLARARQRLQEILARRINQES